MVTITQLISGLALAATAVSGAALSPRAVINHDAVVSMPETVPDSLRGRLYLRYKPYLKVFHGCVPFPAVDSSGNTGGGLKPTGAHDGKCSKSTGQVYARAGFSNGKFGIMYSWYMPKDAPTSGNGHRHEWENVVVWLSEESDSAAYLGISASAHGKYEIRHPRDSHVHWNGDRPLIGYKYLGTTHQMAFTGQQGGEQPLVAWETLPDAPWHALEDTDFGSANVPFINKGNKFYSQLSKAEP